MSTCKSLISAHLRKAWPWNYTCIEQDSMMVTQKLKLMNHDVGCSTVKPAHVIKVTCLNQPTLKFQNINIQSKLPNPATCLISSEDWSQ